MPTLESVSLEDGLLTMLKGEPGTRKSTEALSYPTPQYWISTDWKMEALRLPASKWGVDLKLVEFDNYEDWSKPQFKLEGLRTNCKYKTLIVDSITSIGDNINRQTLKTKGQQDKGKRIGAIAVNSIEDFNAEASAFQDLMAMLVDIKTYHKIHVIIIAHVIDQRKDDEANKLTHHSRVIVTGGRKAGVKIPSYCTEVYHFNVKPGISELDKGEYQLFTAHTGNDFARTGLPLPEKIVFNNEPLYSKWIQPAIKDQMKVQQIPTQPTTPTNISPFQVK